MKLFMGFHVKKKTQMNFSHRSMSTVNVRNMTVTNSVLCIHSIGSLGASANEDGVQNVTVTNSVFTKTQNGVRIKTWARASNSFVTNISFRNLIMKNVGNPIMIDQKYCPSNQGCPRQVTNHIYFC